jgi:hypothetical protein
MLYISIVKPEINVLPHAAGSTFVSGFGKEFAFASI